LRAQIFQLLQSREKPAPSGYFRLPVDRAFVLQGHGVIVTGTAISGKIKVGDHVRCLPGNQTFRVRSLQVHNRQVDTAGWGQRIALNLTGQEKASLTRGHAICHEKLTLTSDRFDALLEVRPAAAKGIKNHQRVRVHLGTAERIGKLILLGAKEKLEPKESAYCQVTLLEPILALRGDHFIIRDETARRTLGGGTVIHPWAKRHKQAEPGLEKKLAALHSQDVLSVVETLLDNSDDFALAAGPIHQFLNLSGEEIGDRLDGIETLRTFSAEGEKLYTTEKKWCGLKDTILGVLQDFHAFHPLAAGMDMEELRGKLPYVISSRLFRVIVEILTEQKFLAREGNLLRLPQHRIHLGDEEKSLMEKIQKVLRNNPLAPPDLKQMEKDLGIAREKLAGVIRVMERNRSIVRVTTDLYYLPDCVDKVRSVLYKHFSGNNEITAATFRDLLGSSRKYTIALLEHFDREGITVRIGDIRRLKSPPPAGKHETSR
jgi:selenocysteine-specific elongation factor